jgi:hypothetical protein
MLMSLLEWAKAELEQIGKDEDGMQDAINKNILEVVEVFSKQGHSGFSASYALGILKRLLDYKPITPLTGEDGEWSEPHEGSVQQNNRCYSVFRNNFDNSTAYHADAKIFSDDGGELWFTNRDSAVPIVFPYTVPEKAEKILIER